MTSEVVGILVAIVGIIVTVLVVTIKSLLTFSERLTRIETLVERAEYNTKPDHGNSPYDKLERKMEELAGLLHYHLIENTEKDSINA